MIFTKSDASDCVASADELFGRMKEELLRLRDAIPLKDVRRFDGDALAKTCLVNCMQLSGQVLMALKQGMTFLASIGFRTLLEHEINVKYVFANPKQQTNLHWVEDMAADFWKRTKFNTHKKGKILFKNNLGGKTVSHRAREVRRTSVYNTLYAKGAGYVHALGSSVVLNKEPTFYSNTIAYSINTLILMNNVTEYIAKRYKFQLDKQISADLRKLKAKYYPSIKVVNPLG